MKENKQQKQLLVISDPHGQGTPLAVCYCADFFDFPPPRLIVVGDLCHRGPDPGLLLRMGANEVILGDHDLNFLSAICGSLKAIAHELRNGYRSNQQDFYKIRGINLDAFEKLAQKNYPPHLVTKLKSKLKRTVNNVEELAAFVMWTKLADGHELRLNELGLTNKDQFFQYVQDTCNKLAGSKLSLIVSSLNRDEKRILEDIQKQLIDNKWLRELAGQLFEKGTLLYKEDNMLFVHAIFPISASEQFVDLNGQLLRDDPWSYWKDVEKEIIVKSGEIFKAICKAYNQNKRDEALNIAKSRFWDTNLPDKLFELSDSEYSPAFARKQTRAIHTFFRNEEEAENKAQILIREKTEANFIYAICDKFNVDKIIVGHISNEDGDIKAYKGSEGRSIISIDPFFAKKRGSLTKEGGTGTGKGAGLLITNEDDGKIFEVIRILPETGTILKAHLPKINITKKSILCEKKRLLFES